MQFQETLKYLHVIRVTADPKAFVLTFPSVEVIKMGYFRGYIKFLTQFPNLQRVDFQMNTDYETLENMIICFKSKGKLDILDKFQVTDINQNRDLTAILKSGLMEHHIHPLISKRGLATEIINKNLVIVDFVESSFQLINQHVEYLQIGKMLIGKQHFIYSFPFIKVVQTGHMHGLAEFLRQFPNLEVVHYDLNEHFESHLTLHHEFSQAGMLFCLSKFAVCTDPIFQIKIDQI
ncbi:MAG: hypothetical protein MUO31_02635 [Thermodesulfovibrionales bacterium]|nr:hypothetical protein [Thermodesulfovibrionales bacterium]